MFAKTYWIARMKESFECEVMTGLYESWPILGPMSRPVGSSKALAMTTRLNWSIRDKEVNSVEPARSMASWNCEMENIKAASLHQRGH